MEYLAGIIIGVTAVEVFLRLSIGRTAMNILAGSQDSLRVIRAADIPDEQKQRLLLKNSWRSFSKTCLLALQILILAVAMAGLFLLLARLFALDTSAAYQASFLISTTVASTVYALLRKRFVRT